LRIFAVIFFRPIQHRRTKSNDASIAPCVLASRVRHPIPAPERINRPDRFTKRPNLVLVLMFILRFLVVGSIIASSAFVLLWA